MRFLTSSLALFLSLLLVNASAVHSGPGSVTKRHARLSRSASPLEARADSGKRCPNRKGPKSNNNTTTPVRLHFNHSASTNPIYSPQITTPTTSTLQITSPPHHPLPLRTLMDSSKFKATPVVPAVLHVRLSQLDSFIFPNACRSGHHNHYWS